MQKYWRPPRNGRLHRRRKCSWTPFKLQNYEKWALDRKYGAMKCSSLGKSDTHVHFPREIIGIAEKKSRKLQRSPRRIWIRGRAKFKSGSGKDMNNLKERGLVKISKKRRKSSIKPSNIPEHLFIQRLLQRTLLQRTGLRKKSVGKQRSVSGFINYRFANKKGIKSESRKSKQKKKRKENQRGSNSDESVWHLANLTQSGTQETRRRLSRIKRRSKLKELKQNRRIGPVNKNVERRAKQRARASLGKGKRRRLIRRRGLWEIQAQSGGQLFCR